MVNWRGIAEVTEEQEPRTKSQGPKAQAQQAAAGERVD